MTNQEKYKIVEKEFDEYIDRNKNRRFYFDKVLTRLLEKHDLALHDYYEEGRKEAQ